MIGARAMGARQVVITGLSRDAQKLALVRELSADATVNAETEDVVARVRELPAAVRRSSSTPRPTRRSRGLGDLQGVDDSCGVLSMPVDETFQAVEIIESGRYPFEKIHTLSLPLEQAEDAIHALAGEILGVNPIHLAIVPGAPRVTFPS